MRLASTGGVAFGEGQAFRIFRIRKRFHQFLHYRRVSPRIVLFVVGCQRSGTSLIHHILRLDLASATFDEVSSLSSPADPNGLRLRPWPEVSDRIMAQRAPLVVAKPLAESQHLDRLLGLHPGARALWMFRNYKDVARSNIKFFGARTGHDDLAAILSGEQGDWRGEKLDAGVRDEIGRIFSPDLDPHDAAALFWYARNSLLFSLGFADLENLRLCSYDDLVTRPAAVVRQLYSFLGQEYPGDRILKDVFRTSRGGGGDLRLTPRVEELCSRMLQRLQALPRLDGITDA